MAPFFVWGQPRMIAVVGNFASESTALLCVASFERRTAARRRRSVQLRVPRTNLVFPWQTEALVTIDCPEACTPRCCCLCPCPFISPSSFARHNSKSFCLPSCNFLAPEKAGGEARRARYGYEADGNRGRVPGVHVSAGGDRGQQRVHPAGGTRHASRVRETMILPG